MNRAEAYEKIRTEPDYLVSVMVANNLAALNKRAQDLRLAKADLTADGMFGLFSNLAQNARFQDISSLVTGVNYEPNQLTKGNDKFFFEEFSPAMREQFVGPPTEEDFWSQYEGAGNGQWWTDFDWGGVIDSLGGVINVFGNWGQDGEEPEFTPNPEPNPTQAPAAQSVLSTENLKAYGPWFFILVLVAWMAYRGKL